MGVLLLMVAAGAGDSLERGVAALADWNVERALPLLEAAQNERAYGHGEHALLYQQLGLAYAYLGRTDQALRAFDRLLAIDPGHVVSYELSPKVTFLFEQARKRSDARQPPIVEVSRPQGLFVGDPVPFVVEVLSNPLGIIGGAVLHTRLKGATSFAAHPLRLTNGRAELVLPPQAVEATAPQTLELFVSVQDARGSEVLMVGAPEHPREVALGYEPPTPWYRRWWSWAALAAVVAAGTGAAVYLSTYELPSTVDGSATWR